MSKTTKANQHADPVDVPVSAGLFDEFEWMDDALALGLPEAVDGIEAPTADSHTEEAADDGASNSPAASRFAYDTDTADGFDPERITLSSAIAGVNWVTPPASTPEPSRPLAFTAELVPAGYQASDHIAPDVLGPCCCPACSGANGAQNGQFGSQSSSPLPEENGSASTTLAVAASGNALIDGLLSGVRWNGAITYSDTNSAADYQAGYFSDQDGDGVSAQNEGYSQFTAAQMIAFHAALNQSQYTQLAGATAFSVEAFTNISITYQGAGTNNSTIRGANSSDAGTAYAFYPNNSIYGGDTFFGNAYDGTSNSLKNPTAGNYAWHTMFHELGHSLGLKHGHEFGGPANTPVPAAYNSIEFTVMTYASYIGDVTGGYDYEQWGAPQSYMMLDIQALQYMYGADFTVNSGNTLYTWDPTNGNSFINGVLAIDPGANRIFSTIWDGDGVDTYDLSNYTTNLSLDLRPGQHSVFSAAQLAFLGGGPNGGFARGNVFNALQFGGDARSLIENANGGSGNDSIIGNQAANLLNGNGGADSIQGQDGNDTINGGAGNDFLYGQGFLDTINGGDGNDWIEGGFYADIVNGGSGNDTFYVRDGEFGDTTDGGTGTDRLDLSNYSSRGATVNLAANTYDFSPSFGGPYSIVNVENVTGTQLADTIIGNALANALVGAGGNDNIQGGDGNDAISGQDGNDIIQGGLGNDVMSGGSGVDLVYGNEGNDRFAIQFGWTGGIGEAFFGGAGSDTFDTTEVPTIDATINLQDGTFTYLPGGSGTISLSSVENAWTADGDDSLTGSGEANYLFAGAGVDSLSGLDGSDILNGGVGGDTMNGGAGNDTFYVDNALDVIIEAVGGGSDRVLTSVSYQLTAAAEVESMSTTNAAGVGAMNLIGNNFGQSIIGNAGANIINGLGGADSMRGLGGNDIYYVDNAGDSIIETAGGGSDQVRTSASYALTAGAEVEFLTTTNAAGVGAINLAGNSFGQQIIGNAGNNVIGGAGGNDVLRGLGGSDTFFFNTPLGAGNVDTIVDFNVAADTIRLENAVFTGLPAGALAATAFVIGAAAADALDRIIYNNVAGSLLFDSDGNGAAAAVQFASISAGLAMTAADFFVV
jgi:serralysin